MSGRCQRGGRGCFIQDFAPSGNEIKFMGTSEQLLNFKFTDTYVVFISTFPYIITVTQNYHVY